MTTTTATSSSTISAFDVRVSGTHLVLPALIGARGSAIDIAAALPDDLTGREVTVDAALPPATSQGFADEFIKQVFEVRNASSLAVSESSAALTLHLRQSAISRGFAGQVFIDSSRGR